MTEEKQENGTKLEEAPRRRAGSQRYSVEQKLRAVRLYLEEGYPMDLVLKEIGIGSSSLGTWLRQYRKEGEAGLRRKAAPRPGRRLPAAVIGAGLYLPGKSSVHQERRRLNRTNKKCAPRFAQLP
jgi:transposase-like protein